MRVLFFTASAIAACIASVGSAIRLEEQNYESYAQINVFEDAPAPQAAPAPKPAAPEKKPAPAPKEPAPKAEPVPAPEKKEAPKVAPKPAPAGQKPAAPAKPAPAE